ncbi:DUF6538 domain-containing protein [Aliivibrio sp.]|uniref:DUF6538 domain-containing protein n=1 Tax=Aliivibrio sp. TaxID=1872443 RepID=UPI003D2F1669
MYLLRLPNSVYYTRIATPLPLRERGYPKEFKFSLLTRDRKVAYLRNIEQLRWHYAKPLSPEELVNALNSFRLDVS